MIPRELIDTAQVPGGAELRLFRRGGDFMIVLERNELMNSRMSGSEEALAVMTCERLKGRKAPRLLIGGYGMGFTLRAALAALGSDAELVVAELVPKIIAWARGPMVDLAAGCLDDPRVAVIEDDVAAVKNSSIVQSAAPALPVNPMLALSCTASPIQPTSATITAAARARAGFRISGPFNPGAGTAPFQGA